ncbi:hypothetical protein [Subtercola vilae]|uniref:hypothetical protein n=1 Tax=Subtercola vilae TaxID=2056433 RepID=UPI0010AA8CB4|nr:hypothetical protein [Subtercola vilae]
MNYAPTPDTAVGYYLGANAAAGCVNGRYQGLSHITVTFQAGLSPTLPEPIRRASRGTLTVRWQGFRTTMVARLP